MLTGGAEGFSTDGWLWLVDVDMFTAEVEPDGEAIMRALNLTNPFFCCCTPLGLWSSGWLGFVFVLFASRFDASLFRRRLSPCRLFPQATSHYRRLRICRRLAKCWSL